VISWHHTSHRYNDFSLWLSFDKGPMMKAWNVYAPVENFEINVKWGEMYIGFSGPHGIVPLSTTSGV